MILVEYVILVRVCVGYVLVKLVKCLVKRCPVYCGVVWCMVWCVCVNALLSGVLYIVVWCVCECLVHHRFRILTAVCACMGVRVCMGVCVCECVCDVCV